MGHDIHKIQANLNLVRKNVQLMALRHVALERILRRGRLEFAWLVVRALFVKNALLSEVQKEEAKVLAEGRQA